MFYIIYPLEAHNMLVFCTMYDVLFCFCCAVFHAALLLREETLHYKFPKDIIWLIGIG